MESFWGFEHFWGLGGACLGFRLRILGVRWSVFGVSIEDFWGLYWGLSGF